MELRACQRAFLHSRTPAVVVGTADAAPIGAAKGAAAAIHAPAAIQIATASAKNGRSVQVRAVEQAVERYVGQQIGREVIQSGTGGKGGIRPDVRILQSCPMRLVSVHESIREACSSESMHQAGLGARGPHACEKPGAPGFGRCDFDGHCQGEGVLAGWWRTKFAFNKQLTPPCICITEPRRTEFRQLTMTSCNSICSQPARAARSEAGHRLDAQ